jgi:uncharacterized membrane protein
MTLATTKNNSGQVSSIGVQTDRPIRSLAKALSWRVTGSLDTILLSWFFIGDWSVAAAIGLTEVATKMFLFYGHERIWNRIPLGRSVVAQSMESKSVESDSNGTKLSRFSMEKQRQ